MREKLMVLAIALALVGCAQRTPNTPAAVEPRTIVVPENKVHGDIDHPWVEPMYDVVEVPAQIDPTNTYYRPSHQTIVEIRPDRYDKVKFDGDKEEKK